MANLVKNILECKCSPRRFNQIVNFVFGEDENNSPIRELDFNRIRPMPEELKEMPDCDHNVQIDIRNEKLYDCSTWTDWCYGCWGTTSNLCETCIDFDRQSFEFNTAWSAPISAVIALSNIFPAVEFILRYADECIGSNCGSMRAINGMIIDSETESELDDPYEFASNVWGDLDQEDDIDIFEDKNE